MIKGERIRQVRELQGWTQKDVAELLGVTQPYVVKLERDLAKPSEHMLDILMLQTGFPPAFFHQELVDFPEGSLLFRSNTTTPAKKLARARHLGAVGFHLAHELLTHYNHLALRLPNLGDIRNDPITAARMTRSTWGLPPDRPLSNLVRTVERAGVLVLAIPELDDGWDAFSAWVGSGATQPVVVVKGDVPTDRLRTSVGHELGHLALHHPPIGSPKDLEREAYQFAAELLMPEQAMREVLVPPVTLTTLADVKSIWKVSIRTLIRRARDLGIISSHQYAFLNQNLSRHGWATREPRSEDIPIEKPRLLKQIVEDLYGSDADYSRIAEDVHLPTAMVEAILNLYQSKSDARSPLPARRDDNQRVLDFSVSTRERASDPRRATTPVDEL